MGKAKKVRPSDTHSVGPIIPIAEFTFARKSASFAFYCKSKNRLVQQHFFNFERLSLSDYLCRESTRDLVLGLQ